MVITSEEKALTIIGLVLKSVVEGGIWKRFIDKLRSYVGQYYALELPTNLDSVGVDRAAQDLVRILGEQRALLSVYRIEEEIDIEDNNLLESSDSDEAGAEEENNEEEEESEYCSVSSAPPSPSSEDDQQEDTHRRECPETAPPSECSDDSANESEEEEGEVAEAGQSADTGAESPESPSQGVESLDVPDTPPQPETRESADARDEEEDGDYDVSEKPDCVSEGARQEASVPTMRKHLERQAMLLKGALSELDTAPDVYRLSVRDLQTLMERYVFNPPHGTPLEHAEVRYNFYPPFMTPKTICNYHVFSTTMPIPFSCKANRYGTDVFNRLRETNHFKRLPKWRVGVSFSEELGDEVTPVVELEEHVKMVPLEDDISRLQWAKSRGSHILFFSYPSLHFPPKISKMLMESLLQPFAEEGENGEPCLSDEEVAAIVDPQNKMSPPELAEAIEKKRRMVVMCLQQCVELELMERVFREPSSVKKMQEVLHHTLHHGFVKIIREVAKVNLSNYATFHGTTYNNLLNNCIMGQLFEGQDKEDYLLDCIYLFLVLTWQTGMGMWQQAIDDGTIEVYSQYFQKHKRAIYAINNLNDMASCIVDVLMDGDRLADEMRKALPNFITLSQISSFRQFLMERSNIPSAAAPFYPTDFLPLAYKQSHPKMWNHVYLMQVAYFLLNHGGYCWEPESQSAMAQAYCPCNLCSPHRMPQDNVALHNEMEAIGTFEIQNADGKSFKLTPELWTNAYLDKFVADDYHPFNVFHHRQNPDKFSDSRKACVTQSPEIFTLIRQIQENREEFMLNKGKGVYKDPVTGEELTQSQRLPSKTSLETSNGLPAIRDGPVDAGSQSQSPGVGRADSYAKHDAARRGYRRRVYRKPGHGGGLPLGGRGGPQHDRRGARGGGGTPFPASSQKAGGYSTPF